MKDTNKVHGPETRKFLEFLRTPAGKHISILKTISVNGIDIGYGGKNRSPAFGFTGYDTDSKNFDPSGKMPFKDESFHTVYSSHCLEHIPDTALALREWHRILKTGGHMVLLLPHKFLYEKKAIIPSRFNKDHKRFYTPASLMCEVECALTANTYRVRHLMDLDDGFDYSLPPVAHSTGNYSIVLILQKIKPPAWGIE